MIDACIEAYQCTRDEEWIRRASTCFDWYLGKNDRNMKLFDHASGGCRDGLQKDGVNENQGAESTLSYILSLLALYNLRGLTVKTKTATGTRRARKAIRLIAQVCESSRLICTEPRQ